MQTGSHNVDRLQAIGQDAEYSSGTKTPSNVALEVDTEHDAPRRSVLACTRVGLLLHTFALGAYFSVEDTRSAVPVVIHATDVARPVAHVNARRMYVRLGKGQV